MHRFLREARKRLLGDDTPPPLRAGQVAAAGEAVLLRAVRGNVGSWRQCTYAACGLSAALRKTPVAVTSGCGVQACVNPRTVTGAPAAAWLLR